MDGTRNTTTEDGRARWILLGLLLGLASIASVAWWRDRGADSGAYQEVEQYFPRTTPEQVEAWTEEYHRRGDRFADVPDPPGEGEVVTARYWLARDRYDMEVRRRGRRFVVAIGGVAEHVYGGAWMAFGEGRIDGDGRDFRGATATFAWSCLGLRYRHASDGLGRLRFGRDGNTCEAIYMAWEAPGLWAKSYGERHAPEDERPPYGSYRGQIPVEAVLPRLEEDAGYRVRVHVTDAAGAPIAGAIVQLKGRSRTRVQAGADGRCVLAFRGADAPFAQSVAAGANGYRNGESAYFTGDADLGLRAGDVALGEAHVVLTALPVEDHGAYRWQHASGAVDADDAMACGTCHPWHYDQWYESRHARMADSGHVTWTRAQMQADAPGAPDDCTGCHQPGHAALAPQDPWRARGPAAGNHCDFCHKIRSVGDVRASGVFGAYGLLRPAPGSRARPGAIQHVFGSSADATYAYMGAAYNPLFQSSHLCAGCHQGGGRWREGGVPKVDTFEEWKAWAAERPDEEFRSCLDCHMPGASMFDAQGRAMDQMAWDAQHRSPQDVHGHRFLGSEPHFARNALDIVVTKRRDPQTGEWVAEVSVTNTGAGHKVPTGTWSKHVLVGVWAQRGGRPLRQTGGRRLWLEPGGEGGKALEPGDWSRPGGLLLGMRELQTLGGPIAPLLWQFWHAWPAEALEDTRLSPGETRTATCRFEAGEGDEDAVVEVRVLHRRGWLPHGAAGVPWTLGEHDPQPEVLWARIRR